MNKKDCYFTKAAAIGTELLNNGLTWVVYVFSFEQSMF